MRKGTKKKTSQTRPEASGSRARKKPNGRPSINVIAVTVDASFSELNVAMMSVASDKFVGKFANGRANESSLNSGKIAYRPIARIGNPTKMIRETSENKKRARLIGGLFG